MKHAELPARTSGRGPDPRSAHIRAVLVRSGNRCAFPDCEHPIVSETGLFIAQLCHIEAAAPAGPRFKSAMSDEERRSAGNLLLLCYRHHVETDDVEQFPVDRMHAMKRAHETQFIGRPFVPPEGIVEQATRESENYWNTVSAVHIVDHVVPELRVEIDAHASSKKLISEIRRTLDGLQGVHDALTRSADTLAIDVRKALVGCGYDPTAWDRVPYYENPTVNRDWEWIHLGLPNHETRLSVLIQQLELRLVEKELLADPSNSGLRSEVEALRATFLEGSKHWGLVD